MLDDVVSQMVGLYTMIGENGVVVRGAASAVVSRSRLLSQGKCFDSRRGHGALDNKTEHEVAALDIVGRRCTTIVIAHRLSTVRKCDQVFEVVKVGSRLRKF